MFRNYVNVTHQKLRLFTFEASMCIWPFFTQKCFLSADYRHMEFLLLRTAAGPCCIEGNIVNETKLQILSLSKFDKESTMK